MPKLDQKKLYRAFYQQRYIATVVRGIKWRLTFEQWLKIWIDSGHLHERGRNLGQYVMARFGDKGPYAVGNVSIVTVSVNHSEYKHSPETYRRIAEINKGNQHFKGKTHTARVRKILSLANKGIAKPWVAESNRRRRIKA